MIQPPRTKAAIIKSLLLDGAFRPSEIADIAQTSRPYVSRVRARMRAPMSRYSRMDAQLQTLWHEFARLRDRVNRQVSDRATRPVRFVRRENPRVGSCASLPAEI